MLTFTKKIKKNNYGKLGFTLVETLVAIGILSLSILSAFTAVQTGLQASVTAKDQITAFYLVQEAMEYVKNIRDKNALNLINAPDGGTTWLDGLSSQSDNACWKGGDGVSQKTCVVDVTAVSPNDVVHCSGTCPVLKRDPTTGRMGYNSSWADTSFIRSIQFNELEADQEVLVTITISWTQRGATKTFQVSEILFNRFQ